MSTLKVNNIQDTSGGATTLVSATNTAKAWVRFDGTGTPSVSMAYNVTTIGDRGVGEYTVNFTTAVSTATNYPMVATNSGNTFCSLVGSTTTTSVDVRGRTVASSPQPHDTASVSVVVFSS